MPANLTPEYKAVEAAYRNARDPRERLERLREMLRTIPKHKGTDHLQGDIKRRIKELSEELERPCQRSPYSEPPGSGKLSHPGSPKLSQAGSPIGSHPGARPS